jgi:hypothetical protein
MCQHISERAHKKTPVLVRYAAIKKQKARQCGMPSLSVASRQNSSFFSHNFERDVSL